MLINDSRELFIPQNRLSLAYISIEEVQLKDSKIKKTACMAWDYVELIHATAENYKQFIPTDYQWVALETSSKSQNIYTTPLPVKMAVFLGNEIRGIQPEILSQCPTHIHIPMTGEATSMNVSHAASVCLFEWLRQQISEQWSENSDQ